MPADTLTAPGMATSGVPEEIQFSTDAMKSSAFASLTVGAGAYGADSAEHFAALAAKVEALTAAFIVRGDISVA